VVGIWLAIQPWQNSGSKLAVWQKIVPSEVLIQFDSVLHGLFYRFSQGLHCIIVYTELQQTVPHCITLHCIMVFMDMTALLFYS